MLPAAIYRMLGSDSSRTGSPASSVHNPSNGSHNRSSSYDACPKPRSGGLGSAPLQQPPLQRHPAATIFFRVISLACIHPFQFIQPYFIRAFAQNPHAFLNILSKSLLHLFIEYFSFGIWRTNVCYPLEMKNRMEKLQIVGNYNEWWTKHDKSDCTFSSHWLHLLLVIICNRFEYFFKFW